MSLEAIAAELAELAKTFKEAGARHSASDQAHLQNAHDSMVALGANCAMKESASGGDPKETADTSSSQSGLLKLTESAASVEVIELREAKTDYEIKLIAPGKGQMAYYPA